MKINLTVKTLLKKIVKDLHELKAINIEVLNIKNRSALGDYMIVVSGTSSRHVNAIVNKIVKSHKKNIISTEGLKSTDWSIVDFGDIILNIFKIIFGRCEAQACQNLNYILFYLSTLNININLIICYILGQ